MPLHTQDASDPIFTTLIDTLQHIAATFLVGFYKPFLQFADGAARLSWPFMLTMLAIAYWCFLSQRESGEPGNLRGFMKYLRIREIFLHSSSQVDYRYILLNGGLKALIVAPFLVSAVAVSKVILYLLTLAFGTLESTGSAELPVLVGYSLCILLAMDLGNYWTHRFHHEIPYLWQLHKVHHSAEVLNPVTAYRVHPLESLLNAIFNATLAGIVLGLFSYLWNDIAVTKLFGINVFLLFTNLVSGNLRHSHIWFSYGPVLERFVCSPAQHQIHHSDNPIHFNKNYAVHFTLWDWAFGTLYTTTPKPEKLNFGLGSEGREFDSVFALWTRPLVNIAEYAFRRRFTAE